jgi:hypothetical protein
MTDRIVSLTHPDNYTITYQIVINDDVVNRITVDIRDTTQCRETVQYFQQLANRPDNTITNLNRVATSLQLMTLL